MLDRPKHLLPVAGEPILCRTQRLLEELEPAASIAVIGWPALARAAVSLVTLPEPGYCVLDGISQTGFLWGTGRVLVLLGDVVWSREALAGVVADNRRLFVAGTRDLSPSQGEAFALSFADREEVEVELATCPCRVSGTGSPLGFRKAQGGHLRRFLWWAQRRRGLKPPRKQDWCPEIYHPIDDWTDDIDTPRDLERLGALSRCARAEQQC